MIFTNCQDSLKEYKINEIFNTFLPAGFKFTSEMHLRQTWFEYSACGSFAKKKKEFKNLKKQEIHNTLIKMI